MRHAEIDAEYPAILFGTTDSAYHLVNVIGIPPPQLMAVFPALDSSVPDLTDSW
jgi:hypothetical protein